MQAGYLVRHAELLEALLVLARLALDRRRTRRLARLLLNDRSVLFVVAVVGVERLARAELETRELLKVLARQDASLHELVACHALAGEELGELLLGRGSELEPINVLA